MNHHHSLFLKLLLLLCLVTFVIAYSETEKRDVHRIILRSRRPRSHHHRGHKHTHHHHEYKKRDKRGKYRHREPDYSFEDSSRYIDSRENSYESTERHKPYYRRKPIKPTKHRPYYTSSEYEGEKYKPKGEWTPLFSSETISHFHPDPFDDFTPKKKRKEKFKEPFRIEITTHYPETTQFYPFYNTEFPNYNNNNYYKKTSDVEPLPLTRGFNDNDYRYKRNNTYEVHENHDDGEYLKGGNFQALAPIIAVANTELAAEASHFNDIKKERENFKQEKKGNGRQRGRRMKMQNYQH